jgi:hypothetical protein
MGKEAKAHQERFAFLNSFELDSPIQMNSIDAGRVHLDSPVSPASLPHFCHKTVSIVRSQS